MKRNIHSACTDEILSGLGQMYATDERFKKNTNKHADATAEFIKDAIFISFMR